MSLESDVTRPIVTPKQTDSDLHKSDKEIIYKLDKHFSDLEKEIKGEIILCKCKNITINWKVTGWLVFALFWLVICIGIGIWSISPLLNYTSPTVINLELCHYVQDYNFWILFLSKLTLLPFCIVGLYFSGQQYIRQKNLLLDTFYKRLIARNIQLYEEHLIGEENKKIFMAKAIDEIHKHPLESIRSGSKKSIVKEVISATKDLSEISRNIK